MLALSLVAAVGTSSLLPTIAILCVAVTATYLVKGPFWALSTEWLSASAAAAGIAQINAIGNIGGFVGPYLLGYVRDATGSFTIGLVGVGAILAGGGILVLFARD